MDADTVDREFNAPYVKPPYNDPSGVSQYERTRAIGTPMFSIEKPTAKGDRNIYTYYTAGWFVFLASYQRLTDKSRYEIIREGRPMKLYMDLDAKYSKGYTTEQVAQAYEHVVAVTKNVVHELFGVGMDYFVMDSSSAEKFSKHLIFDLWLTNVNVCKELVLRHIVPRLDPALDIMLDKNVYTKNRNFRLLYSHKVGSERVLLPDDRNPEYNEESMIKSLITCYIPNDPSHPFYKYVSDKPVSYFEIHDMEIQAEPVRGKRTYTRSVAAPGAGDSLVAGVERLFNACGYNIHSRFVGEDMHQFIVQGVRCPFKGDVHDSNKAFFNVDSDLQGYFLCADSDDCPRIRFGMVDMRPYIFTMNSSMEESNTDSP